MKKKTAIKIILICSTLIILILLPIFNPLLSGVDFSVSELFQKETTETEEETEEEAEFVKMYELSNIEYVADNGEALQGEFIPGSEVYIFREGEGYQIFEYRYKNYPSYERMLNDSNYSIESVFGAYTLNSDHTQLSLIGGDGSFRYAEVNGDKIIIEYCPEGYDLKMVSTYTETDSISI